jgi:hypothetical protein
MEPNCVTRETEYADDAVELRESEPAIAAEVASFRGIDGVLAWMQRSRLTSAVVDIVGQDEFNYDFLIQLEPGGRWIAFGVT